MAKPLPPDSVESALPEVTATPPQGHIRWAICALLFFATTINYMDRQVIGILAPRLQHVIGWNELQYSNIVFAFQVAYAIGLLMFGPLIDRIGTRIGYVVAIAIWSLSAMGHALARTVLGFGFARFMLGLGESGNFPTGIKTVTEWFPRKERALATGLFNSGSNVGAILAPLLVPYIAVHYGWQAAFLLTGFFSAIWIVVWLIFFRSPEEHPRLSRQEFAYIQSDPLEKQSRVPWRGLLVHRQTWTFLVAKFMTDPIWWFFLYWLPKFLNARHNLSLLELGAPLVVIYLMSDLGSIGGGWISSRLIKNGWTVNGARKLTMGICASVVVPIMFAAGVSNLWTAVVLIGLAAAGHQGWSANLFTLASDMFPQRAVGSVVGIGGFGGAVGGMCIARFTGFVLQTTHSYVPMFVIAGSVYLIALAIVHVLSPRLEPANLGTQ